MHISEGLPVGANTVQISIFGPRCTFLLRNFFYAAPTPYPPLYPYRFGNMDKRGFWTCMGHGRGVRALQKKLLEAERWPFRDFWLIISRPARISLILGHIFKPSGVHQVFVLATSPVLQPNDRLWQHVGERRGGTRERGDKEMRRERYEESE